MQQKGKVTHFHFPTQILEMAVMDRAFVESGKGKVKKDEARQSWVKPEPAEGREHLVNQQQDQKDHSHRHSLHRPSCSS